MPGGLEKLHGLLHFLAWCLSSPLLIPLSLSPPLSFLIHDSHFFFFLPCSLCLSTICHPLMSPFPSLCFYQSLGVTAAPVPFFTAIPRDTALLLFLSPLTSFLAKPLPPRPFFFLVSMSFSPSRWHSPHVARAGSA